MNSIYIEPSTPYYNKWELHTPEVIITDVPTQYPSPVNVVGLISAIDSEAIYTLQGNELKQVISSSFFGHFDRMGLVLNSVVDNKNDTKDIDTEEAVDKSDLIKLMNRITNPKLKKSVNKQMYKFDKAQESKNKPISIPKIDEETAKKLFDFEEKDY